MYVCLKQRFNGFNHFSYFICFRYRKIWGIVKRTLLIKIEEQWDEIIKDIETFDDFYYKLESLKLDIELLNIYVSLNNKIIFNHFVYQKCKFTANGY